MHGYSQNYTEEQQAKIHRHQCRHLTKEHVFKIWKIQHINATDNTNIKKRCFSKPLPCNWTATVNIHRKCTHKSNMVKRNREHLKKAQWHWSKSAVMVLTRLPLLAGPTDGERFSGRRRGRVWQRVEKQRWVNIRNTV